MTKSNELRISLAEWLYRMSESAVPYQARALAIYAVAFKATSNEELAVLVGMDTKGVADKTYNKWKRYLSEQGWVIVKRITIGRVTTIEVSPAFKETPVTFTDLLQRNPNKFRKEQNVTITEAPAVKVTDEASKDYGSEEQITAVAAVEITDELAQDAPAHTPARVDITSHGNKESPSEIITSEELARRLASSLRPETNDEPAGELAGLNGSAELMIGDIQQWLEPPATKANARQWLASTVRTFGQDVTAQSYHKLKTDLVTGGLVAKPLQAWAKIAQRMKAEPKSAAAPAKDAQPTRRERIRGYVEEAQAKLRAEKQKWSGHS
jgi:hypothetical protein